MPIKLPTFDKKEDVPAAILEFYEEKDGKWVPKPDDDDVEGLKGALAKERKRADDAEKARKDAEKDAKQRAADAERQKQGVTDEQLKKIRADVKAELDAEYKPKLDELDATKKDNRTLRLDNAVKTFFGKKEVGVRAERHDTLWKLIGEDFDLTDDGKPMVKATPGTPIEKYLVDVVKKQYPEFFAGTQGDGGGAAGDKGSTSSGGSGDVNIADILANPAAAMQRARAGGATA